MLILTQSQIDKISVIATQYVKNDFDFHEDDNPPEITPGMVVNVLKAADAVEKATFLTPCKNQNCGEYNPNDPDGSNCNLFWWPSKKNCEHYKE